MNDDEARYLIDQFNKYVSWRMRELEAVPVYASISLASSAVLFSTFTYVLPFISLAMPVVEIVQILIWFLRLILFGVLAAIISGGLYVVWMYRDHRASRSRLLILEDYRFKYKSLPDGVTFRRIVNRKYGAKLEKLLRDDEHSIMERGHL